jgi:hypothetical protein
MQTRLSLRTAALACILVLFSINQASAQSWRGHSSKRNLRGAGAEATSAALSATDTDTVPKVATTTTTAVVLHKAAAATTHKTVARALTAATHAKAGATFHNLASTTQEVNAVEQALSLASTHAKAAKTAKTTHATTTPAAWAGHAKKASASATSSSTEM